MLPETTLSEPMLPAAAAASALSGLEPVLAGPDRRPGRVIRVNGPKPRRRVRRVPFTPEPRLGDGEWHYECLHGGGVSNGYDWPASSETFLAVTDPFGNTVCAWGEVRAHAVTYAGAAGSILPEASYYWDRRCGPRLKARAAEALQEWHRRYLEAAALAG